jgi:lipopolysaccharide export system permease protein
LFFIGAPLGAIIRKGGLGMPVVISTLAFIIYHIVGQIGENAAVEGSIPVWVGMWLSSIVFLPLGIVLTMKATSDSSLFNSESWMRAIEKLFHIFKTKKSKQDNENTANLL